MASTRACVLWICALGFVFSVKADNLSYISMEQAIMDKLLADYNPDLRPVQGAKDPVTVRIGMGLINLEGLDEGEQILYLTSWFRLQWKDIRLKWNATEFGKVNTMRFNMDKLWKPDLVLYNSRADFSSAFGEAMGVVYSDGSVMWIPPIYTASHCAIDLTDFPYDTQVCKLKFGSWTYGGAEVDLDFYDDSYFIDTTDFRGHHEFEIVNTNATKITKYYPCCPEDPFPDITFTLELKRIKHSMNHMLVTPCVLGCFFLPVIFLLPPESDEKILYGVGLFIGNCLLLMHISEVIGFLHLVVPPLANYHLLNLALSCLALAISALIRNIWAKGKRGSGLPVFVKEYFLGIFGRMMRVPRDAFMPVGGTQPNPSEGQSEVMANEVTKEDDREQILKNFAKNAQAAEWKQLAVTLDRLSFVIFFVICLITTIVLFTK